METTVMRQANERFWDKIDISDPSACWLWKASVDSYGYGHLTIARKLRLAHRTAWELTHGEIPKGLCVLHSCDVPPCCNPSHLWLGTQADNVADMGRKGRAHKASGERHFSRTQPGRLARGEHNGSAKLTSIDIPHIRTWYLAGFTLQEIGDGYGLHNVTISRVVRRVTWRHVA